MSRELWQADRLADRSMEKVCPDPGASRGANGASAKRELSHGANGASAKRAEFIDPQADGQADVCECPACAISAFPCLADPPPLAGRGRYIGLDRGPRQDETQSCDPLDARAMAEIEGRVGDDENDDGDGDAEDRR